MPGNSEGGSPLDVQGTGEAAVPVHKRTHRSLKKRLLIWIGIFVATGLVLALMHPAIYYTIIGYLKREAFYAGRPTSYWVHALKKEEDSYAESGPFGAEGKALRDGRSEAVPVLIEMLRHVDMSARSQALVTLNVMKLKSPELISPLRDLLNTESDLTNLRLAMQVLTQVAPEASLEAPAEVLKKNTHLRSRVWSVVALTGQAKGNANVLATLLSALHDDEAQIRMQAAIALDKVGPRAAAAIPQLRECLSDTDVRVRLSAAETTWHLTKAAEPSLPVLIDILSLAAPEIDETDAGETTAVPVRPLRLRALLVLSEMGPLAGQAVPALIGTLKDEDITVRSASALVLGRIGPAAKHAVPILQSYLKVRDHGLHIYSAVALARISPGCADAVRALIDDLRDEQSATHIQAAMALGQIGPAAESAIPELVTSLKDRTMLGVEAARALWKIGHKKDAVVESLVEAVRRGDNFVQMESLRTLSEIGPSARAALPTLVALWVGNNDVVFNSRLAVLAIAPPPAFLSFPNVAQALRLLRVRQSGSLRPMVAATIARIDPAMARTVGATR
jgi:HEAT repeat protein